MNEYVIAVGEKYVVMSGNNVSLTCTFSFASVFTKKDRAEKLAKKHNGFVENFYGFDVKSTKSTVVPKQSQINRGSPYRSV